MGIPLPPLLRAGPLGGGNHTPVRAGGYCGGRRCFQAISGRSLTEYENRRLVLGALLDRAKTPWTRCWPRCPERRGGAIRGRDTAELQCHGSPAVLTLGLEALFAQGVRQARPGEFTRRAFLNGKLDLTPGRGRGRPDRRGDPGGGPDRGDTFQVPLSRRIGAVYDALVDVSAHFHAVLDYRMRGTSMPFGAETLDRALEGRAGSPPAGYLPPGQAAGRGIPCAIGGQPNCGKVLSAQRPAGL